MSTYAHNNVIDLRSSSDEEDEAEAPVEHPSPRAGPVHAGMRPEGEIWPIPFAPAEGFGDLDPLGNDLDAAFPGPRRVEGGQVFLFGDEEIFIPDEGPPEPALAAEQTSAGAGVTPDAEIAQVASNHLFSANDCLARVLEIFPDISHEHVRSLFTSFDSEGNFEVLPGRARLDNIIEQLVSSTSYPKQEQGKLKRKRESSIDTSNDMKKWEGDERVPMPNWVKGSITAILKADFPDVPRTYINLKFLQHKHLFQSYVALAKDSDNTVQGGNRAYGRGRASKLTTADGLTIATNCGHAELVEELIAARQRVVRIRVDREATDAKNRAEKENLEAAIAAGETAECSACFDDLPMNRQIHCNGPSAHFTCFDCAETYIKSEVGDSRCNVNCPAGCGANFANYQLNLLSDKQLVGKLAQLQQEKDIRDAGLDDLEDCPFCEYKCIMPPIEENFEFQCANPECQKISCRRCKAISHIPVSCEEHAKENKINSRHKIEEAMTAAMIRSCNKCKKQFIKDYGCNKMSCPSCGNLQCYVCSATLKNYDHFDQQSGAGRSTEGEAKKCPLYDNVEERHEREVKEAEAKARAEVVESNPDVSPEDLEIKVSDAVKTATKDRIKQGGGAVPGAYYRGYAAAALRLPQRLRHGANDDDNDEDGAGFAGINGPLAQARLQQLLVGQQALTRARNHIADGRLGQRQREMQQQMQIQQRDRAALAQVQQQRLQAAAQVQNYAPPQAAGRAGPIHPFLHGPGIPGRPQPAQPQRYGWPGFADDPQMPGAAARPADAAPAAHLGNDDEFNFDFFADGNLDAMPGAFPVAPAPNAANPFFNNAQWEGNNDYNVGRGEFAGLQWDGHHRLLNERRENIQENLRRAREARDQGLRGRDARGQGRLERGQEVREQARLERQRGQDQLEAWRGRNDNEFRDQLERAREEMRRGPVGRRP